MEKLNTIPVIGYAVVNGAGKKLALEHTSKGYVFGVSDIFYTVYKSEYYAQNDITNFNRRGYHCEVHPIFGGKVVQ